ncbi:MAG: 23S rRNA (adenine(2030)-N(6))-methyltransferase RlmJ [Rhodospirillaceae bacterium]|nr:23S rRNA (adenine(2030)-N(6))-methyltransferase RlmJ [Rhodospirillaceae bacterium]
MLSYRHAFHAGGAADVHKHAVLSLLLDHLAGREKPFCVIDIYAGRGIYGLNSEEAQKRREFTHGIRRVIGDPNRPGLLNSYWRAVDKLNPDGTSAATLARYPGSPQLIRDALRKDDVLIVNELHPADHEELTRWAGDDKRIHVHKRDALEALVALTPPAIRRGLVLIDPAYEVKTEYDTLPAAIADAFKRWPQATYAIWYAVLPENRHSIMRKKLMDHIPADILETEFELGRAKSYPGMQASGLWIINPPWQIDQSIKDAGDWLAKWLGQERPAKHSMTWLRKSES